MRYRMAVLALCLLGAFASGSAWANRYYSPETGRFITRDPIGYRGGFALYEYAFSRATMFVDTVGHAVTINLQPITAIPWSAVRISSGDPRKMIKAAALPYAAAVVCACSCCDPIPVPTSKYKMNCSVNVSFHIYIDPENVGDPLSQKAGWTMANTYGHEQRHVQKFQEKIRDEVNSVDRKKRIGECRYDNFDQCERDRVKAEKELADALIKGIQKGDGHSDDPGERDKEKPGSQAPYDPLAGTNVTKNNVPIPPVTWPDQAFFREQWTKWGLRQGSIETGCEACKMPPRK